MTHTLGGIPLDDGSVCCRDLYLKTHNTHKIQVYMPPTGIEPTMPASERQLTHAVDRAATGIGPFELHKLYTVVDGDICEW
jgi:hypothetical protein